MVCLDKGLFFLDIDLREAIPSCREGWRRMFVYRKEGHAMQKASSHPFAQN
jgi:hypothetical protein